jgi:hypothetical protein
MRFLLILLFWLGALCAVSACGTGAVLFGTGGGGAIGRPLVAHAFPSSQAAASLGPRGPRGRLGGPGPCRTPWGPGASGAPPLGRATAGRSMGLKEARTA